MREQANGQVLLPTIATWIVLDDITNETTFPSVGPRSSSSAFQQIYWQCLLGFFVSSLKQNPRYRHVLFCNKGLADVEYLPVPAMLLTLGVELVELPITYRLPQGAVSKWGNQFYILDIVDFIARTDWPAIIVTDADCVWLKSADGIARALQSEPILAYTLTAPEDLCREGDKPINGMTRNRMGEIVAMIIGDKSLKAPPYHGGEFFAASQMGCRTLSDQTRTLWSRAVEECFMEDSIKEEAHFLSILYAANAVPNYSANPFIRRMWTAFKYWNLRPLDAELTLWHLPAEKRLGFRRFYKEIRRPSSRFRQIDAAAAQEIIGHYMGYPRRSLTKLILDALQKLADHTAAHVAKLGK